MRASAPVVPELCPAPPRLVSLTEAASYLRVSVWTVRDWAAAGIVRRVRLPGSANNRTTGSLHRILFDVRDLDALVERSKDGADGVGEGR